MRGPNSSGLINAWVNLPYQHQITASSSYADEVDMTVAAGDTGWVLDNAPMIRDTGDFTITLGNTTYHLNNVSFDSPDPNRQGQWVTCSLHANASRNASTDPERPPHSSENDSGPTANQPCPESRPGTRGRWRQSSAPRRRTVTPMGVLTQPHDDPSHRSPAER